jgi:hypothetical protein
LLDKPQALDPIHQGSIDTRHRGQHHIRRVTFRPQRRYLDLVELGLGQRLDQELAYCGESGPGHDDFGRRHNDFLFLRRYFATFEPSGFAAASAP